MLPGVMNGARRALGIAWVGMTALGWLGCQASVHARAGAEGGAAGGEGRAPCESPAAAAADVGPPPAVRGNGVHVALKCGTYHGDLVVHGNDAWVYGAGKGQTIIDGRLEVHGNGAHVSDLTVRGESEVHGNNIDVSGADLAGPTKIKGNNVTK
jgi:hypothetical protein